MDPQDLETEARYLFIGAVGIVPAQSLLTSGDMTPIQTQVVQQLNSRIATICSAALLFLLAACESHSSATSDAARPDQTESACATVGCSAPPLCSVGCQATCGCCTCAEGTRMSAEPGALVCRGGCWDVGSASNCSLDSTYTVGFEGGLVAYFEMVTLSPPAKFQLVRTSTANTVVAMCSPDLPACGDATRVDASDISRDLSATDVQSAFAQTNIPLYGRDDRPMDGQIFVVTRADGRGVSVGSACRSTDVACVSPPAGVQKLVDDLRVLIQQQRMDATCVAAGFSS